MRAKLFLVFGLFCFVILAAGTLGLVFAPLACAQEEEEPVQTHPSPLEKRIDKKSNVTTRANTVQRTQGKVTAQDKAGRMLPDDPLEAGKSKTAMPPDPLGASRAQKALPPDPYESQKTQAAMPVEPLESTKNISATKAQKMNAQKMMNAGAMENKASQVER